MAWICILSPTTPQLQQPLGLSTPRLFVPSSPPLPQQPQDLTLAPFSLYSPTCRCGWLCTSCPAPSPFSSSFFLLLFQLLLAWSSRCSQPRAPPAKWGNRGAGTAPWWGGPRGWPWGWGSTVSSRVSCSGGQGGQAEAGALQHSKTALPMRVPPSQLPPLQPFRGDEGYRAPWDPGSSVHVQGAVHSCPYPTPQPH